MAGTDGLWYKDAVIYQTHVRCFYDTTEDGIGDFRGLTDKLPYLQDLGVTAVWLLPFYPSPLRDEGYDIADYCQVHKMYGTLNQFRSFLKEAHRRGIRVITELVINHTSDQHPWFKRARVSPPGSAERDFYVWNETPDRYPKARVIFKDFEQSNWCWDPVAKAYYWHRFYSHQPDLNFDNPRVKKALFDVLDFWYGMGVDGLRLDAVPYLFERDGTNCENLPETHAFLKALRAHMDAKFPGRMLLAEANQWPEDAAAYFGSGDECHMAFHFPIMPRLFMAAHMEDRHPIIDILRQTPEIPAACQWAIFLRNHDELTLEMVTDEERDYMYRVYAKQMRSRINLGIRHRLAPLVGNNRRKIELLNALLFSMPGTPVIYYGDEIGMGDNIYLGDRNGVRTPMQWSADRNAGFSKASPHQLYLPVNVEPEYHYETVNAESQNRNLHSLLWWMKRLIAMRKRYKAFGRGTIEFLSPENPRVLVFVREYEDEKILVIANLSRFSQYAEMDLSRFEGMTPTEMFSLSPFPPIGKLPYLVTLGPHGVFWFLLKPQTAPSKVRVGQERQVPKLECEGRWSRLFLEGRSRQELEEVLAGYLPCCRWFAGKDRRLKRVRITGWAPAGSGRIHGYWLWATADYVEGQSETYLLPVDWMSSAEAQDLKQESPLALIAEARIREGDIVREGVICDALYDRDFCRELVSFLAMKRHVRGQSGMVRSSPSRELRSWLSENSAVLNDIRILKGEQTNTSVVYGERIIFKVFRKTEDGVNPELEIGRFLNEKTRFRSAPRLSGYLEFTGPDDGVSTMALLQEWIPNQGNAWSYTLNQIAKYFDKTRDSKPPDEAGSCDHPIELAMSGVLQTASRELIGDYTDRAAQLGLLTSEMHMALASDPNDPAFAPEPFSFMDQRSLYQSVRSLADRVFETLQKRRKELKEADQAVVSRVLECREKIMKRVQPLIGGAVAASKIRCHGDYHLGQLLFNGSEFYVLDFEGEPARSLEERRLKRQPLKDAAGMVRSFHYAAWTGLWESTAKQGAGSDQTGGALWAEYWYRHVTTSYLKAYLERMGSAGLLPAGQEGLKLLFDAYLIEKVFYEIGYELKCRPEWVSVPLRGLLAMTESVNT